LRIATVKKCVTFVIKRFLQNWFNAVLETHSQVQGNNNHAAKDRSSREIA